MDKKTVIDRTGLNISDELVNQLRSVKSRARLRLFAPNMIHIHSVIETAAAG